MASEDYQQAAPTPPLTIDEIVERDNVPASADPPPETMARLSTRNLHLSGYPGLPDDVQRSLQAQPDEDGVLKLSFPSSVFLGQAGKSGERVAPGSLLLPAEVEDDSHPHRPDWVPLIYHPKTGARPHRKPLRRADGSRVIPLMNQSFIYPPDDRKVFYPSGYPWHCIGKVDVFASAEGEYPIESGSGVLIGTRLVLTAGHVPPVNPAPGRWKMRFTAGLYNGSPVDGPGAVSYVSDFRGYVGSISHDYAVLRLYQPLGVDLGYFGWKTYDSSWDGGDYWWLAGYPFDIAGSMSPSYQNGIPVLDQDSDGGGLEIEHHGDAASGDSGGPFWGFWEDGPYVVGTTSSHETISGPSWVGGEDNNIEAGGDALSQLLQWGRSTWPA